VRLVLLWGKGVGGLEVRGVCEGERLEGEERKRPGEMGAGAGAGAGAGVWGAGVVGEMVDRFRSITHPLRTYEERIYQDDVLKTSRPENQEKNPVLKIVTIFDVVEIFICI